MPEDPMHIDNVRVRQAADSAERDMFRDLAREIDGPSPPGIGALLRRALSQPAASTAPNPPTRCCDRYGIGDHDSADHADPDLMRMQSWDAHENAERVEDDTGS